MNFQDYEIVYTISVFFLGSFHHQRPGSGCQLTGQFSRVLGLDWLYTIAAENSSWEQIRRHPDLFEITIEFCGYLGKCYSHPGRTPSQTELFRSPNEDDRWLITMHKRTSSVQNRD